MNKISLTSLAETKAELAENLNAFSGLKLLHVKKEIARVLSMIGRDGIFDQYTKHDISHIDYMLDSLEWLIPDSTKILLTPSDWLLLTLSIYFHDLGMLVTKDEFQNRSNTIFVDYKLEILGGKYGFDFKDKILNLKGSELQDRFIYQELVRKTHAERIKYWISGEYNPKYPIPQSIISEIRKLISSLDSLFIRDLSLLCESHHLADLDDFDKYKPNQQYGPTKLEKANMHYCALILRTADLLHITSDRTPSIEFNLVNPNDPISQDEWYKQRAVKSIIPQLKKNKDGQIDNSLLPDTLEVTAYFEEEKGFFGLINYINFAKNQLQENFKFNALANRNFGIFYEYPWKSIDDSKIETKDFEKKQFEFIIDQKKILDLLVGHTLYNDSSVVLRELTQNGIDAVRFQRYELSKHGSMVDYIPIVEINWDEKCRELCFKDNGTGMTLDIIHNHLLKVGSSRYQEEDFKKKFPDFSPISRFGIGLLTCFLIADDVDIITKSSESEKAILLKIKKVHGKYLLKYISTDKLEPLIKDHGTIIKLHVRSDVVLDNIENDLSRWVLIPQCNVRLSHNGNSIIIGYENVTEVLNSYLTRNGYIVDNESIRVSEVKCDDVTMAYALRYTEVFDEWEFLVYKETDKAFEPIGICIEGIRVDFNTPGYNGKNVIALVDASGLSAPRTNVARSNIEMTPEREKLLYNIYTLLLQQVSSEIENLRNKGHSITWAANEASYLLRYLTKPQQYSHLDDVTISDVNIFEKALSKIESIVIERNETRELKSLEDLKLINHFWTIDSNSYSSADSLIKELKSSNSSALALLKTIFGENESNTSHIDVLLCRQPDNEIFINLINKNFEVDRIKLFTEQRRIDLRWSVKKKNLWKEVILYSDEFRRRNYNRCYIQLNDILSDEEINQIAIYTSSNDLFILKNSSLNTYLVKLMEKLDKSSENEITLSRITELLLRFFYYKDNKSNIEERIDSYMERFHDRNISKILWSKVDKEELVKVILETNFIKYDNSIWSRRIF